MRIIGLWLPAESRPARRGLRAGAAVLLVTALLTPTLWPHGGPARGNANAAMQGGTWAAVRGPRTVIHALIRAPWGALYAGASTGVYTSRDDGATWRAVGRGLPGRGVEPWGLAAVTHTPGDAVLAAAGDGAIYRLDLSDGRWRRAGAPIGLQGAFALLALPERGTVIAGSDRGIYRSSDGGRSWRQVATAAGGAVVAFARDPSRGALYAGLAGVPQPVRISVDDGRHWRTPDATLPPPSVEALVPMGGHIYAGVMGAAGTRAVWSAGGAAFTPWGTVLPRAADGMALAVIDGPQPRLLVGTMSVGVYSATPRGSWERLGREGPGDGVVTSLLVLPGPRPVVLTGTAEGIYRLRSIP